MLKNPKKEEDIFEKLEKMLKNSKEFSKFTQFTQRFQYIPDNPYGHAWSLIHVKQGKLDDFEDLLNPHLFLGSVEDPKSLSIYQNDLYWLTSFFTLARKDEKFKYVFEPLWYSFLMEIRVTSTLDGSERIYQAFKTPVSKPKGFRFFKRRTKKKKEPIEYLIPEEEEYE